MTTNQTAIIFKAFKHLPGKHNQKKHGRPDEPENEFVWPTDDFTDETPDIPEGMIDPEHEKQQQEMINAYDSIGKKLGYPNFEDAYGFDMEWADSGCKYAEGSDLDTVLDILGQEFTVDGATVNPIFKPTIKSGLLVHLSGCRLRVYNGRFPNSIRISEIGIGDEDYGGDKPLSETELGRYLIHVNEAAAKAGIKAIQVDRGNGGLGLFEDMGYSFDIPAGDKKKYHFMVAEAFDKASNEEYLDSWIPKSKKHLFSTFNFVLHTWLETGGFPKIKDVLSHQDPVTGFNLLPYLTEEEPFNLVKFL